MNRDKIYFFDPVELEIKRIPSECCVLDIGGGGEGVIGRVLGRRVVAIDCREDELAEAPEGPLKIVMDATDLKFMGGTFPVATAFFSLMYFDEESDLQTAFAEIFRVLKPQGHFRIWDVDIPSVPETDKPIFAVSLKCVIDGEVLETAYGRPWLAQTRDNRYYRNLAEAAGFTHVTTKVLGQTFHSTFRK